jgi:glycogen operon protein
MTGFAGGLAQLRQRFAQLRARHWLEGKKTDGAHDIQWLRPDAAEMQDEDWKFPEGRFLAYVLGAPDGGGEPLFIVFNAAAEGIEITLPGWPNVGHWSCVLDTAKKSVLTEQPAEAPGAKLTAPPASILAFAGTP